MIFYYVVITFYPDLTDAKHFEERLIPFHNFEEAVEMVEVMMDLYEDNDEMGAYEIFWIPDTKATIGFITIKDNGVLRAFRFEVIQGKLDILK